MLRTPTGMIWQPLSVGTSDNPVLPEGSNLSFDLSPLPVHQDGLALYTGALAVTFAGTVTQSGGTGVLIPQLTLLSLLINSLALNNAKFGTPISPNWWKGYWLPTILDVGCGYTYGVPNQGGIPAANGTYSFRFSAIIPLCIGNGPRPHHTMQLQALYRNAQFVMYFNADAQLAAFSTGSSLGTTTVKCSAGQLPEGELRVGPGVEWVDYDTAASSGQTAIKLQSFGNNTQLTNTEQGAGVSFLMAMSSTPPQVGAINPGLVTQMQVPFRGQPQTAHPEPLVLHQQLLSMGTRRMLDQAASGAGATGDNRDFPYDPSGSSVNEMYGLRGLTLVPQSVDFEFTKAQVVNGDTYYNVTVSSGPTGTHHTLAQHLRSWTPQMWADAEKEIVDSGLKRELFGSSTLSWTPKMLYGKHPGEVDPRKLRFLPMTLKPTTAKASRFRDKL